MSRTYTVLAAAWNIRRIAVVERPGGFFLCGVDVDRAVEAAINICRRHGASL